MGGPMQVQGIVPTNNDDEALELSEDQQFSHRSEFLQPVTVRSAENNIDERSPLKDSDITSDANISDLPEFHIELTEI